MALDWWLNSADDHMDMMFTPADAFESRLPAKFKAQAPRVEIDANGNAQWFWEGKAQGQSALGPSWTPDPQSIFSRVPGAWAPGQLPPSDPKLRIEHMDRAHIWAAVIYGPTRKPKFEDSELGLACNRAYNDFMLDLSSTAPDRIIGLVNLPTLYPEECVKEATRVAALGAKGVEFSAFGALEVWDPVWEPLWSVLEEAEIVVSFHVGDAPGAPYPPNEHGRYPAHFCYSPFLTQRPMANIIFSGVLDRHPKLKVAWGECRVGWLSFYIEHMDRQARERPTDVELKLTPSEYWDRQMIASYEDDVIGAHLLVQEWSHLRNVAVWGCDYPHNAVSWPDTEALIKMLFGDGHDGEAKHSMADRTAEFFKIVGPA